MQTVKHLSRRYLSLCSQNKIRYLMQNLSREFRKLKKVFFKPEFPNVKNVGVNLHLGCGPINHKGFINIDGYPFPHVHYVRDISNLSIFDDNSVDLIYASHCLEHFKYSDVLSVLEEWTRVLKDEGVLRLSVPDFDLLLKIYYANEMNPDAILPQLLGGQNNKYNFHYTVFNKKNLMSLLSEVGFEYIREWIPNKDKMSTFNDFSNYQKEIDGIKYPVSLNIEASKIKF